MQNSSGDMYDAYPFSSSRLCHVNLINTTFMSISLFPTGGGVDSSCIRERLKITFQPESTPAVYFFCLSVMLD